MTLSPEQYIVEYRDINLVRKGQIPVQDLDLKLQPVRNGVGTWSLTLPAEHRAVPELRKAGAGIVVTDAITREVVMSGPSVAPSKTSKSADPIGMTTIGGISDDFILWDALAYPQPSNADPATQTLGYDVRTGSAEDLMRQYVSANIANGAAASPPTTWAPAGRLAGFRSKLILEAVNKHLGSTLNRSARFDVIGDLLADIASVNNLMFRVVQRGSLLQFEVVAARDMSKTIRLDVLNGTLDSQSVAAAPPQVTQVIVAGQGQGSDRTFVQRNTTASIAAEALWGRRIENFKDQRNTNVLAELQQAGDSILADKGFTKTNVKAVPSNDQTMVFMRDFRLGDLVTVVVDGQETLSTSTEAAIVINSSGVTTGVAIGDVSNFDSTAALRSSITDTQQRVAQLEKNAEVQKSGTVAWIPTWINLDPGSAAVTARYSISGNNVMVSVRIVFAADTVVSGIFYPVMPSFVSSAAHYTGVAWAWDASAGLFASGAFLPVNYYLLNNTRANATTPWTWTTGDIAQFEILLPLA